MAQFQNNPQSPAPMSRTSTLSIVSLVCGIAGFVLVPVIGGIAAVITGNMAKKEIGNGGGLVTGNGLATAGLVLGYINIVLIGVPICVIIILALLGPAIGNIFSNIILTL